MKRWLLMTINNAVARRIIKLMNEKDFTQYKLEQKSGIAHGAMDRIFAEKIKPLP